MSKILKFPQPKTDAFAERNKLVEDYMYVVEPIAKGIHSLRPPSFELDDLVSIGMIALIEAADRFDPELGVPFEAWAKLKVRGAIMDATRRKQYRESTHDEIQDWHAEMCDERLNPEQEYAAKQEAELIRKCVVMMTDEHRHVVEQKYHKGRALGPIGMELGVNHSHGVTQLHRSALTEMRQNLRSHRVGLVA